MRLFDIDEHYNVRIDPIAYSLIPFKTLWDRDKSKDKATAKAELAFVYFKNDYKSDFYNEVDETLREQEVIKFLFKDKKWSPDKAVRIAEEFYKERQKTISSKLLEGAYIYASKIEEFFRTVDLAERDNHNKFVFNPKMGNDILKDLGKTVESLKQLEDMVRKEQEASSTLSGGRKKGIYAD